jgi:hypothetical protein
MLSHTGASKKIQNSKGFFLPYDYFPSRINIGFADIVRYLHGRLQMGKKLLIQLQQLSGNYSAASSNLTESFTLHLKPFTVLLFAAIGLDKRTMEHGRKFVQ